ncbi:hypothetical protein E2C01_072457 [Portunus trituberculatus]|uniref:Uncharacterized protein n=1 Tax=Portunus trituberculatus TaxID=210409 RepID=A0A5B7I900_PORTR|nr:hypothetical protein [Portunus trituberculatus]
MQVSLHVGRIRALSPSPRVTASRPPSFHHVAAREGMTFGKNHHPSPPSPTLASSSYTSVPSLQRLIFLSSSSSPCAFHTSALTSILLLPLSHLVTIEEQIDLSSCSSCPCSSSDQQSSKQAGDTLLGLDVLFPLHPCVLRRLGTR